MSTESTTQQPVANLNSRENLNQLLDELIEKPLDYERIKARMEEMFIQERTIMILDLSGFTRTTQVEGIIPFLLMIYEMQKLAMPCIEERGGLLVRAEADNLTCILDSVDQAVEASLEITDRLESANVILPESRDLYVSIGIGHGKILNVENEAIYGNQVNLASKLGEDLANKGEILITEKAYEQIADKDVKTQEHHVSISGVDLHYYSVEK